MRSLDPCSVSERGFLLSETTLLCGIISVTSGPEVLWLRSSLKYEVGRVSYGKGTVSTERGLRSPGNCYQHDQKDMAMGFIYVHWKPFCAGNRSLFLCSNCCVIPSLVSISCLLPRKCPVAAECKGLLVFYRVASGCCLAGCAV